MMVYKELIRKEVLKKTKDQQFANSYLNFKNFVIIPHHGKLTASILMKLCSHLGIDYFVISDFDFDEDFIGKLDFKTQKDYEESSFYKEEIERIKAYNSKGEAYSLTTKKAMITTNWRLLNESIQGQIHFNIPRLEELIGYGKYDKSSLGVWDSINRMKEISPKLFPEKLKDFLEINQLD